METTIVLCLLGDHNHFRVQMGIDTRQALNSKLNALVLSAESTMNTYQEHITSFIQSNIHLPEQKFRSEAEAI